MKRNIWKTVESNQFKITVEEVTSSKLDYFIATYWEKDIELEQDRTVLGKFETSGGAMGAALDKLSQLLANVSF